MENISYKQDMLKLAGAIVSKQNMGIRKQINLLKKLTTHGKEVHPSAVAKIIKDVIDLVPKGKTIATPLQQKLLGEIINSYSAHFPEILHATGLTPNTQISYTNFQTGLPESISVGTTSKYQIPVQGKKNPKDITVNPQGEGVSEFTGQINNSIWDNLSFTGATLAPWSTVWRTGATGAGILGVLGGLGGLGYLGYKGYKNWNEPSTPPPEKTPSTPTKKEEGENWYQNPLITGAILASLGAGGGYIAGGDLDSAVRGSVIGGLSGLTLPMVL